MERKKEREREGGRKRKGQPMKCTKGCWTAKRGGPRGSVLSHTADGILIITSEHQMTEASRGLCSYQPRGCHWVLSFGDLSDQASRRHGREDGGRGAEQADAPLFHVKTAENGDLLSQVRFLPPSCKHLSALVRP